MKAMEDSEESGKENNRYGLEKFMKGKPLKIN